MDAGQKKIEENQSQGQVADIFAILKTGKTLAPVINEKLKRCRDFKEGIYETVPLCYKENTPKEELVLEHVIQFNYQYKLHYDERRELFLYPKNECDVYKFICTTIRPQKLGYLELYNYKECAQYLSYFIQYEQLDPPDRFPLVIPSPTNVCKFQKGDCFDLSIVLCSLLIGVGYDAYCVYGIAPRSITSRNQSDLDYLYLNKGVEDEKSTQQQETDELKGNEFAILKKPEIVSKYDTKKAEQEKARKDEEERIALTIDDDEPDEMGADPYTGRRIHCWVMIKGNQRGVERPLFIEPTTGRIYEIYQSPYLKVDSVFNHRNFWVNMKYDSPVRDINFNEMNTSMNWEYVMLDTLVEMAIQQEEEAHNEIQESDAQVLQSNMKNLMQDQEQLQLKEIALLLDMPPPWPPKMYIDKEKFLKGTPLGESTVFYKKCRVDSYAPYAQLDGLVQKIIIYQDFKRLKIQEIRYFYEHRSDKLTMKRRFPFEFKTIEEYAPGRTPHWRQIVTIDRRLRVIKYYPNRNNDGLIKRIEQIGEKTIEYYENRDDRVIYRSVRFDPSEKQYNPRDYVYEDNNMKSNVLVLKMTIKFQKNQFVPAHEQIAKCVIDLDHKKNKVYVYYHMYEGQVAPKLKEYPRENMLGFAKLSETGGEKKIDDPQITQDNQKILQMEKECFNQIKSQENLLGEEARQVKEEPLELEKTLHDKARERYKEQKKSEEEVSREQAANDYLYPFLEKKGWINKGSFNYQEAVELKNEVMSKLKERLLSRAEIIQKKLEEERHNLEQAEQSIQKKTEIDKNYENEITNINFKIDILEQRALRFEANALTKYEEMDRRLNEDQRLSALHQKK